MKTDIIINLIKIFIDKYNSKDLSLEDILTFREEYDDLIDYNRDTIITEIGKSNYELLDDIYMDLELYEENIDIRNNEKYCIDEHQLLKRISEKYMKLYK